MRAINKLGEPRKLSELRGKMNLGTLETINANNSKISYIGRSPDASPATGYAKRHILPPYPITKIERIGPTGVDLGVEGAILGFF